MNRTIRNLVIAVPLVTVGLTMVNVGAATAGPNDPNFPIAIPDKPKGPKDIADAPKPKGPKGPKDIADAPKPKAPKPAPQPQAPQSGPAAGTADETVKTVKADKVITEAVSAKGSPDSIDRSDLLFVAGPADTTLEAAESDNGMDLTWLLIGGGLVTASGAAFAARKRTTA